MKNVYRSLSMLVVGVLTITILAGCGASKDDINKINVVDPKDDPHPYAVHLEGVERMAPEHSLAVIDTEKGVMVIELYDLETPITVANFKELANTGFYNGLTFHMVQQDFVVQTGDPTESGTGDSGTPPIILETHPDLLHVGRGVVGMARIETEKDSATSQFYITLADLPELDGKYAVFGKVVKGIEILDRLKVKDVITGIHVFDADLM